MSVLYYSTSLVDRFLYYFYPFYLHVYAIFAQKIKSRTMKYLYFTFLIILHFAILLFWLTFSNNSEFWLPYRFYPLTEYEGF